jgi:hypothetical protein
MAVAIANKDNGTNTTTEPFNTASITWTAGARGMVCVASATNSGSVNAHTVTGGSVTWDLLGTIQGYGGRRGLSMFLSDDTPSNGTLSIAVDNGGTYQESIYSVDEITGQHDTTVTSGFQKAEAAPATSLNLPSLGTIDSGDLAVFACGFEAGADNLNAASGSTEVIKIEGGGNVRSFLVGKSTTDDTPGVTWDTSGNACGLVGVIVEVGAVTNTSIIIPTGPWR